jgi:hypothetical protein
MDGTAWCPRKQGLPVWSIGANNGGALRADASKAFGQASIVCHSDDTKCYAVACLITLLYTLSLFYKFKFRKWEHHSQISLSIAQEWNSKRMMFRHYSLTKPTELSHTFLVVLRLCSGLKRLKKRHIERYE